MDEPILKKSICKVCGKEFEYISKSRYIKLICSKSCYSKRYYIKHRELIDRETFCTICNKPIEFIGKKRPKFCREHTIEYENKKRREEREKNPIRFLLDAAKHRSKTNNLEFNITKDDLSIPNNCPILGIPIFCGKGKMCDNSPTIDRINSKKGYIKGNVQIISNRANMIKNNGTSEEHYLIYQWLKNNNL